MNRQKLFQQVMGAMLITLLLVACGAPAATPIRPTATPTPVPLTVTPTPVPPTEPVAVVQATYDRWNEGDLDGSLEFFADDAVMCTPGGCIHGIQKIRDYLTSYADLINRRYELSDLSVDGNVVTYTAKGYEGSQLKEVYDGLDVVVDGRIIFEGTKEFLRDECDRNPSQAFCPED